MASPSSRPCSAAPTWWRWPGTSSPPAPRCGSPAGRSGRTEEARAAGAALTMWDADPARGRRARRRRRLEVTWAGPPPAASPPMAERVAALSEAGATWVVFGWPVDVTELVAAARTAGGASSAAEGAWP